MKPGQISIGSGAAIALAEGWWWKDRPAREIAEFQMQVAELCMPFREFHRALTEALGRPVFTHELGLDYEGLLAELMGNRPAPTLDAILALIPEDKRIVVDLGDRA